MNDSFMNKIKCYYILSAFILFGCKNDVKNDRQNHLKPEMEIIIPKGSERARGFFGNEVFKNNTANKLNLEGTRFLRNGEYLNAEEKFIEALKYESDNPTILNNLGNLTSDFGNEIKAIEFYKKAIKCSDSTHFSSLYNLGLIYCETRDYNKSEEVLTYVLRNFDNKDQQSVAHIVLTNVYLNLKYCEKAKTSLNQAKSFMESHPEFRSSLERLQERTQICFENSQ